MMLRLHVRPEAKVDLKSARTWYEAQRAGLGDDFIQKADDAFQRVCQSPAMFPKIAENLRICLLERFPYVVYFRTFHNRVQVVGVFHTSRDKKAWTDRTRSK